MKNIKQLLEKYNERQENNTKNYTSLYLYSEFIEDLTALQKEYKNFSEWKGQFQLPDIKTLRDEIAIEVLKLKLESPVNSETGIDTSGKTFGQIAAEVSYLMADYMLEARKK